jgi:ligand-binding sensor domain-containing protein
LTEWEGIRSLGEDENGTLLVGMGGGLRRFVDGKIEGNPLPHTLRQFKAQLRIFRDHGGGLWIGTADRGLVHVHQGRTDVYTQSDGLSDDYVNSLFEDREGNLWVGTRGGLDRFRNSAVATFSVKQGLTHNLATSVLASRDGSVWIGSAVGGLNRFIQGQITTFGARTNPGGTNANSSGDTREGKLNGESPNSLFQDSSGRIWVSTQRAMGYLDNDHFIPMHGIHGGRVLAIAEDLDGNLWLANQDIGLFRLFNRKVMQQLPWGSVGHKDPAMALAGDPSHGGLWLGFLNGGVAYFKDGKVNASYGAAEGLAEGQITGFRFDHDGTLWVSGTGGVSRLKNGHFATLNSRNGLPCDLVHGGIEDNEYSLWLYMSCGLVRISRAELDAWSAAADKDRNAKPTIRPAVLDISDGVRSHATTGIYSPRVTRSLDGKLWFLPTDGVSVINPHNLSFNKLPPPVHIEQITANGKSYDPLQGLHLPPAVHDLVIDYTALSLIAPERVTFRVKLEGQDDGWRALNDRHVRYTNLTPRQYRFRVTACNNSGVWNEEGASLDFAIAPAYYQTTCGMKRESFGKRLRPCPP